MYIWIQECTEPNVLRLALPFSPGLAEATDVILTGTSAGSLAVQLRGDAVRAKLPPPTKVIGLSISGFFWELQASPCGR